MSKRTGDQEPARSRAQSRSPCITARKVGVRELKSHASEILSEVREQQAEYIVTHRGHPVGLLVPHPEMQELPLQQNSGGNVEAWQQLEQLGRQIGKHWQGDSTPTEAVSEQRR